LFGYIKPLSGELKVREFELYKAFYCGLCKTMGKNISHFSRLALSYDMVFLVLLRSVLICGGETAEIINKPFRCKLKPAKKRSHIKPNEALLYSSCTAAILMYYKCIDDIRDTKNKLKKLLYRIPALFFSRMKKKACVFYPGLDEKIRVPLAGLNRLEKENCKSIDGTASCFAELMQNIMRFGIESVEQSRIAGHIGRHMGRWLYIIDALDDFDKDIKKGEYNPFGEYYDKNKNNILKDMDIIRDSLTSSLHEVSIALCLADSKNSKNNKAISGIMPVIENIVNLGMSEQQEKILRKFKT